MAGGKIVESRTDVKNPAVKYNITHEIVGGELVIVRTFSCILFRPYAYLHRVSKLLKNVFIRT